MIFEDDTACHRPSAPPEPPLAPPPPPIQVPPTSYPTRSVPIIIPSTMNNTNSNISMASNDQIYNMTSAAAASTTNNLPFSHLPGPWSSGLCDCCNDIHSCCLTCCCPCVAFGRIAEIVDRGSTSCGVSGALYALIMCVTGGCSCLYSCFYRSKLRGQYMLDERPCADCCVHCCCEECALCQEYRELTNQGFDMSIGWHANMERQTRGRLVMVPPPSMKGGIMKR